MLDQAATESNLDYLESATYPEYWPPRQAEPFEQAELHLVAVELHTFRRGMGGLTVTGWINVATASQQQGVKLFSRRKRLGWADYLGGDSRTMYPLAVLIEGRAFSLGLMLQATSC